MISNLLSLLLSQSMLIVVVCLAYILVLLAYRLKSVLEFRKRLFRLPGPDGYPIIGQLVDFWGIEITELLHLVNKFWKQYSHHGLFRYSIVNRTVVHVCRPEYVQKVLSNNTEITKSKSYKVMAPWIGNGLITSTGRLWHQRRKLLTPAFHFRILDKMVPVVNEHALAFAEKLQAEVGKNSFALFPLMSLCTLDIMCETSMGNKMKDLGTTTQEYLEGVKRELQLGYLRYLRPWLTKDWIYKLTADGKEYFQHIENLHAFSNSVIRKRKKDREEKQGHFATPLKEIGQRKLRPFLDLLLDAAEEDTSIMDDNIREETDTIIFAGYETTAVTITWTLYLLGHHPEIQNKVREEIFNVFGDDSKTPVTVQHLTDIKYLDCVIKESMRLYSPVPQIGRLLNQDMSFDDYVVPGGSTLFIDIFFLSRSPELFPNPKKFDPDRFLPDNAEKLHTYAYVPFSAGPRNCIGQRLAMIVVKIMLVYLLRRYSFESIEAPEDLVLVMAGVLTAKSGVLMKIKNLSTDSLSH